MLAQRRGDRDLVVRRVYRGSIPSVAFPRSNLRPLFGNVMNKLLWNKLLADRLETLEEGVVAIADNVDPMFLKWGASKR